MEVVLILAIRQSKQFLNYLQMIIVSSVFYSHYYLHYLTNFLIFLRKNGDSNLQRYSMIIATVN